MNGTISADQLAACLGMSELVILDCSVDPSKGEDGKVRYLRGKMHFAESHIAGAQHADLTTALRNQDSTFIFALPDPEIFRDAMARLGVRDGAKVVLYDRSFTAWAARVWWMLRWIGFDHAVILDGGLNAWKATGHPVTTDLSDPQTGHLSLHLRPGAIAGQPEIRTAIQTQDVFLIDTLSEDIFAGGSDDYARRGHIAGAQNVFTLSMFDEHGQFKSDAALRDMYPGATTARQIPYCGAGILAAATAFVMVQLGFKDVGLYAASLQEWAADPANPMSQ